MQLTSSVPPASAFGDGDTPEPCDPLKTGDRMTFKYDVGCTTTLSVEVTIEPLQEDIDPSTFPSVSTVRQSQKRKLSQLARPAAAPTAAPRLTALDSSKGVADRLLPGLSEAVMSGKFGAFYIGSMCKGMYGAVELPNGTEAFVTPLEFSYVSHWHQAFEKAWPVWKAVMAKHGEAAAIQQVQVNIMPDNRRFYQKDFEVADKVYSLAEHHARKG